MPLPLTSVYSNEKQIAATRPGMAFWSGSGPKAAKCSGCLFWQVDPLRPRTKPRCEEFRRLTGVAGPPIPGGLRACKYFKKAPRHAQTSSR
jgi:hypothetical protein